eukprot:scaffold11986_cov55-Cyclotella_meneghiniana.AAC.2
MQLFRDMLRNILSRHLSGLALGRAPPYTTVLAPVISALLSQCCELLRPVENPWNPMEPALNPVKSLVILYGEISGGTRGRSPLLAKFQRPMYTDTHTQNTPPSRS